MQIWVSTSGMQPDYPETVTFLIMLYYLLNPIVDNSIQRIT